MHQLLRNLILSLATGYILFVFSERIFWSVWRPGDSIADLTKTWLAYSAIAYLFLAAVRWSGADDFCSIFLAGAVYGWLVEGALADTLYGTQPSAPLPVSIAITALSWHALISVIVGWWSTGRALTANSALPLVRFSIAIGVFWGMWAMFPRRETPPILTPIDEFFVNALLLTLGLMAAWWISFRAQLQTFRPGWLGIVICTSVLALFYISHVRRLGALPLVLLPVLLSVALVPLYWHRRRTASTVPFNFFDGGQPCASRFAIMGLIPITATLVYTAAVVLELDRLPIPLFIYVVTGIAGFISLLVAVVVTLRSPRDDKNSLAATNS